MPLNPQIESDKIPVACFAPALDDDTLDRYARLISSLPPERAEVADAMKTCLECVRKWWGLPDSEVPKSARQWVVEHRGKVVTYSEVPLEDRHAKALWDSTPWLRECQSMAALFDTLPVGTVEDPFGTVTVVDRDAFDLRNAAYHLLWHCVELTLDREPLTQDKLDGNG